MGVGSFYDRNLPHWHPPNRSIFLTWNLHGSLPQRVINHLRVTRQELLKRKENISSGWTIDARLIEYKRFFAKIDGVLDKAETGPVWLKQENIAALMQQTLLEKCTHLYTLWSYVVMANHVHIFIKPKPNVTVASITKSLKGYTAREANKSLKRTGKPFWQDESFDHWCRDRSEFFRIVRYIENNPVNAGLVERPEDWPWSSAAERKRRGVRDFQSLTSLIKNSIGDLETTD
jgi:REP-associated tyrosine transposase